MKNLLLKILFVVFIFATSITAQSWNEQLVNSGEINGSENIAYDDNGNPAVVYLQTSTNLRLAIYKGSGWINKAIGRSDKKSYSIIFIEPYYYIFKLDNGDLILNILDKNANLINSSSSWAGYDDQLSVASKQYNDRIYVCITSSSSMALIAYNLINNSFEDRQEIISGASNTAYLPDIILDINNKIWISYYDGIGKNLKVVKSLNTNFDVWESWHVDTVGDVGNYSQIWVDDNNVAHISYYDATNQKLKYATFNP